LHQAKHQLSSAAIFSSYFSSFFMIAGFFQKMGYPAYSPLGISYAAMM